MCYETQMPPYEAIPEVVIIVKNQGQDVKQNLWFQYKGLVTRNMHTKYKSPITYHSKDMTNVKVFGKCVKLQGQRHKVKNYGTLFKTLTLAISYEWQMIGLSYFICVFFMTRPFYWYQNF
jgi:hypothetical protein